MKVRKIYPFLIVLMIGVGLNTSQTFAQSRRVIQLSGIVTDTAGAFIQGVNVYVPKAGRGITTLNNGFFSLPLLVGDSVVISCIGYQRQSFIVPSDAKEFTTLLIELTDDVTILPPLIVRMPTEDIFKEAVLALNVPLDNTGIDPKNMNAELFALMVRTTPMDGNANYKWYMEQFSSSVDNKFHPVYNPFLNPLNWVKFIKDIKKKKKESQNKN